MLDQVDLTGHTEGQAPDITQRCERHAAWDWKHREQAENGKTVAPFEALRNADHMTTSRPPVA